MARQAPRIPRGLAQPLADARPCFTSLAGGETPRITLGQGGGGAWDVGRCPPYPTHNGTVFDNRCCFGNTVGEAAFHASHSQGADLHLLHLFLSLAGLGRTHAGDRETDITQKSSGVPVG